MRNIWIVDKVILSLIYQTETNMKKGQWAIGSEWEDGVLCDVSGFNVYSNQFEDGQMFAGSVALFDSKSDAIDFIEVNELAYAYPIEFDYYLHF